MYFKTLLYLCKYFHRLTTTDIGTLSQQTTLSTLSHLLQPLQSSLLSLSSHPWNSGTVRQQDKTGDSESTAHTVRPSALLFTLREGREGECISTLASNHRYLSIFIGSSLWAFSAIGSRFVPKSLSAESIVFTGQPLPQCLWEVPLGPFNPSCPFSH